MIGGQNMHNLAGWVEVECREADRVRGAQPVSPGSSLTDLDGGFGVPVIYTEWWDAEDQAVLRDYLWDPTTHRAACVHFVPEAAS